MIWLISYKMKFLSVEVTNSQTLDDDTSRSELGFFGNRFRWLEFEGGDILRPLSNAEPGDESDNVASVDFPADLGVDVEKDVASNESKTGGGSGVSNDV